MCSSKPYCHCMLPELPKLPESIKVHYLGSVRSVKFLFWVHSQHNICPYMPRLNLLLPLHEVVCLGEASEAPPRKDSHLRHRQARCPSRPRWKKLDIHGLVSELTWTAKICQTCRIHDESSGTGRDFTAWFQWTDFHLADRLPSPTARRQG